MFKVKVIAKVKKKKKKASSICLDGIFSEMLNLS